MKIAVALLSVLALAGCVAAPPPGPSDSDLAAFNEHLLDETWARTGLADTAERPDVSDGAALDEGEWSDALADCMVDGGITSFGTSYSPDLGFSYIPADGTTEVAAEDKLLFYACVARHPMVPGGYFEALTDEQLDYVYDYYQTTLVPCMILNGFAPTAAPSRVEFHAIAGQWNPYYAVDVGLGGEQYEEIQRTCGPERPQLY